MNAQPAIIQVPLSQLRLSPRNARKTGGKDIEGLAASIAAHNLLQNLTITSSANDDGFEVVAGGRRLAAMQLLRDRGQLDAEFSVPCKLINDDDAALEASTAENTLREAMHPADQFDAFKGMVDAKTPIPDIAAHFGVTELVVRQRLKLARVAPKLVQVYRDGGMDLQQLQTLALSDDHKQQERVWYGVKSDRERSAHALRQRLVEKEVRSDTPLARFVGVDSYEAAGGAVRRDMFSTKDEAFLADKALLDKLALDKLQAVADRETAAGWSWAEEHISLDHAQLDLYGHCGAKPEHQAPTPQDLARVAEIDARRAAIDKALDQLGQSADADYDASEQLNEEDEDLATERQLLERGRELWPPHALATAGVLVYLGYHGVVVERGRLQPGQKASSNGTITGQPKAKEPEKKKKATLSADMVQRLEMHRAAALREHVAAQPSAALQLLLTHLVSSLLTSSTSGSVLSLTPTNEHTNAKGLIQSKFDDVGRSAARKALDDRIARWKKDGLPSKASELHAWIGKLTDAKRSELLALAVALTINANSGQRGQALAEQFNVDMTKWWTATPETYLTIVPKALLAEAVFDVAGKAAGDALTAMKKDGAIAVASKRLHGTGWLPKPLRGAGYKVGKPDTSKAATTAAKAVRKAANNPAKKAAKSAPKKAK